MSKGLQRVLKTHGEIRAGIVVWVWDYKNNCAKKKSEMTEREYRENKKMHKEKGFINPISTDKVDYGK